MSIYGKLAKAGSEYWSKLVRKIIREKGVANVHEEAAKFGIPRNRVNAVLQENVERAGIHSGKGLERTKPKKSFAERKRKRIAEPTTKAAWESFKKRTAEKEKVRMSRQKALEAVGRKGKEWPDIRTGLFRLDRRSKAAPQRLKQRKIARQRREAQQRSMIDSHDARLRQLDKEVYERLRGYTPGSVPQTPAIMEEKRKVMELFRRLGLVGPNKPKRGWGG